MVTRLRSSRVVSTALESTPRIASTSDFVTGCLYAMIAMLSSAARDSRMRRLPRSMRPTHSLCSAVVTIIQPPAISRSSMPAPRSVYEAPSASRACETSSGSASSASHSKVSGSGWSEENSSASIAGRRFVGAMGRSSFGRTVENSDVAERLALHHHHPPELDQLEQRDEGHDHLAAH